MQIHIYQILVSAIAVLMIYQGISNFIKGKKSQSFLKVSARIIIWGGMALIAIFPELTNIIANLIGMQGNVNAVILTGFIFVFLLIFKLLNAIEKLEQNISELTRKDSLKDLDNNSQE